MGRTNKSSGHEHGEGGKGNLKGAFASVLILGGILFVCWLTVFIIYMVRYGG